MIPMELVNLLQKYKTERYGMGQLVTAPNNNSITNILSHFGPWNKRV